MSEKVSEMEASLVNIMRTSKRKMMRYTSEAREACANGNGARAAQLSRAVVASFDAYSVAHNTLEAIRTAIAQRGSDITCEVDE